jgi:hypothetical protein
MRGETDATLGGRFSKSAPLLLLCEGVKNLTVVTQFHLNLKGARAVETSQHGVSLVHGQIKRRCCLERVHHATVARRECVKRLLLLPLKRFLP